MKTLIIHPKDSSTDFLKPIYSGLDEVTLVTRDWSRDQIIEAIQTHDQVMMMGHGGPWGLFGINFPEALVINGKCVEALSQKDNNIFIWCNADRFVNHHNLKGFYSGMFVSEVHETKYCLLEAWDQYSVTESNDGFARLLGACLLETRDPALIHQRISDEYGVLAGTNLIAEYNHQRLYLN
jgi:hypothetical protein